MQLSDKRVDEPSPMSHNETNAAGETPAAEVNPMRDRGLRKRNRPKILQLRGKMSVAQFLSVSAAVFAGLLAIWFLATSGGWVDPLFLPKPQAVWSRLHLLSSQGTLWDDIGISSFRILVGFAIATAIAVPLGILMGVYRIWEAALEPLVDFIRYMPVVAFVPLSIIWVGTNDNQKFLIIFIGTFFQQVLMVMDNTKRIPQDFIDVGRTLGMPDRRILRRIVLPSSAPGIWDSMRITLGWAWTYLTLAELVAASSGLGYRITVGQRFFQTDLIIGYIIVLGILGLITDQVMKLLGRRLFGWSESAR
jgi:NitT/TauT family transport system permease protein